MCRLFLGNKASILAYNKRFGLLNLLQHLEKECGGHGNGYALLKAGKLAGSGKGLKLDSKTIADILLSSSYEYAVYHTRVVSVGSLSDEQCHPFISESTNSALAMNGTIGHLRDIASVLNQSDTQVISFLTSNMSIGDCITTLQQLRAVFVGFQQGIPYVVKTSGDLEQYGSSYLYASSFPLEVYEEARKLHNGFTLPVIKSYQQVNQRLKKPIPLPATAVLLTLTIISHALMMITLRITFQSLTMLLSSKKQ